MLFTLQPSGRVGIGTTAPASTLDVVGTINAAAQYNLGGSRFLSAENQYAVSLGRSAGTSTLLNTLVGGRAGESITTGFSNAFFGYSAGVKNTEGGFNTFLGHHTGEGNMVGDQNVYIGYSSGNDATGWNNTFVGSLSGYSSTTGHNNTFVGWEGGNGNNSGSNNSTLGSRAYVSNDKTYATAIGAGSKALLSDSVYLGRNNGEDTVRVPGILRITGGSDAEPVSGGSLSIGDLQSTNIVIDANEIMARENLGTATLALNADGGDVNLIQAGAGEVGIGTSSPSDKLDVDGNIRVGTSGTNGCLKNNDGGAITGTCSSDARFKRNVTPFPSVLKNVAQLRPVNYFWRTSEFPDKGFGSRQNSGLLAQDVEKVLPELVSTDSEGFKQLDYAKLPLLTIQAIKELSAQNDAMKAEIAALRAIVCKGKKTIKQCRGR